MNRKIFIIAGEHSGDYLGHKVIKDLKILTNNRVQFYGIGGLLMEAAGMKKYLDMSEITAIGITEVIPKLIKIKRIIGKTVDEIAKFDADVLITIDSSGFTHRVAKAIKKRHPNITTIHLVAPPVWAWRPWRAKGMKRFLDLLLTLFPFEPKFFEKYGLKSVFVGHPIATDEIYREPSREEKLEFIRKYKIDNSGLLISLLPGSRDSEIKRHVGIMKETLDLLGKKYDKIQALVLAIDNRKELSEWKSTDNSYNPVIITNKRDKVIAMYISQVAIAASGSVILELASTGTPTISIYKTSFITACLVKLLITTKSANLVNILVKENVIPELLQKNCTPEKIVSTFERIVSSRDSIKQKDAYKASINMIKEPQEMLAAKEVLNIIGEKKRAKSKEAKRASN